MVPGLRAFWLEDESRSGCRLPYGYRNRFLHSAVLEGDVVTVRAGFFEKAKDGIVSTQTIDIEEIRSDPIGTYDIQMMMHSLPSVVTL